MVEPREHPVHLGEIYLNGEAMYEAKTLDELYNPTERHGTVVENWWGVKECYQEPHKTVYLWYACTEREHTILYANFQDNNPNEECVEINVRKCCFFPVTTGVNYITVRGFEMAQAATAWAPPTAEQVGIIGPNWSKGWIIEDNIFHDAKCSAVSLGKEKPPVTMLAPNGAENQGIRIRWKQSFWRGISVGARSGSVHTLCETM